LGISAQQKVAKKAAKKVTQRIPQGKVTNISFIDVWRKYTRTWLPILLQ
jgi:hypothetical protein